MREALFFGQIRRLEGSKPAKNQQISAKMAQKPKKIVEIRSFSIDFTTRKPHCKHRQGSS